MTCGDNLCNATAGENFTNCPADCDAACGNGVIEANEQCDGTNVGGESCQSLDFDEGVLACTGACIFNTSDCDHVCGNDNVDGNEICDGTSIPNADCTDLGFSNPDGIVCAVDCGSVDYSACSATCGDGRVETGEECDGNGAGIGGQNAVCDADCTLPICGDGICNSDAAENAVNCAADCSADCGNGVVEGSEECDGTNNNNTNCLSLGFDGGDLACTDSCVFDSSACIHDCGNNSADGTEVCDGTDLAGASCLDQGYVEAVGAVCAGDCSSVDYTNCAAVCGNATVEPGEACDDGSESASCNANCTHRSAATQSATLWQARILTTARRIASTFAVMTSSAVPSFATMATSTTRTARSSATMAAISSAVANA